FSTTTFSGSNAELLWCARADVAASSTAMTKEQDLICNPPRWRHDIGRGQSKFKPHSQLELARDCTFRVDIPEWDVCVNVEIRVGRFRVIQNVCCIQTQLETFAFADPECLADRRIQSPRSGRLDRVLPEVSARSRLRILQHE